MYIQFRVLVRREHEECRELTKFYLVHQTDLRGAPLIIIKQSVFVTGQVDSQALQVSSFHNAGVCIFAKTNVFLIIYSYKTNPSFLPCP